MITTVPKTMIHHPQHKIAAHYESCFARHGNCCQGVDWPNAADAETRYRIMLEVIREPASEPVRLLDLGCGLAHLYEHIERTGWRGIEYAGLDVSQQFIEAARSKHPGLELYQADLLDSSTLIPEFDYVVMNGVFTEKVTLSFEEMWEYTQRMLQRAFAQARRGIAFNVMSKQVDWEREDLFHLPFDLLAGFVTTRLSRNFVIRNDYGLYEYTTYVYR